MADSFIQALDAEIAELNAQLRADPRFVKIQELQKVRGLYGAPTAFDAAPLSPRVVEAAGTAGARVTAQAVGVAVREMSPERKTALEAARKLIAGRNTPTPTSEIGLALARQGISLSGKNYINSLSALLSSTADFKAHGRSGWTLVVPENAEAANGVVSGRDPLAASNAPRLTSEASTFQLTPEKTGAGGGT